MDIIMESTRQRALLLRRRNTDNPFRSSDLGVMSPARCLCAMSVCLCCFKQFHKWVEDWRGATFPSILPKDKKINTFAFSLNECI